MARNLEPLTLAVWNALEQDPEATHQKKGRALMKKIGYKVAKVPSTGTVKTANFVKWEEYDVDYDSPQSIADTAEACGFDKPTAKLMVVEYRYHKEVNDFNVKKSQYRVRKADGGPIPPFVKDGAPVEPAAATTPKKRGRPKGSKDKVTSTEPPKRRGRRPKNTIPAEELEAFAEVESLGGAEGVQKEIEKAQALIDDLEIKLELVKSLQERVKVAA